MNYLNAFNRIFKTGNEKKNTKTKKHACLYCVTRIFRADAPNATNPGFCKHSPLESLRMHL